MFLTYGGGRQIAGGKIKTPITTVELDECCSGPNQLLIWGRRTQIRLSSSGFKLEWINNHHVRNMFSTIYPLDRCCETKPTPNSRKHSESYLKDPILSPKITSINAHSGSQVSWAHMVPNGNPPLPSANSCLNMWLSTHDKLHPFVKHLFQFPPLVTHVICKSSIILSLGWLICDISGKPLIIGGDGLP